MGLYADLQADLRTAMKERDAVRRDALRLALAAVKNALVADGQTPQSDADDDLVIRTLTTEVKRRKEAAAGFREGGREESALKEEAEAEVYTAYLPAQLSDADLEAIVDAAIAEVGASSPREMGQVMKAVMPKVGAQADGSRVSAMVKSKLTA